MEQTLRENTPWQVGVATIDITPPVGLPLMGNFRDDYAARGVHDPLRAKAIVFLGRNAVSAGLLVLDLCMLDRGNVVQIRRAIGERCRIDPDDVMVQTTHTHSGPAMNDRLGLEAEVVSHQVEIDRLLERAADAVFEAERRLVGSSLGVGHTQEHLLSFNRRLRCCDGTTDMNWEVFRDDYDVSRVEQAWGPIDPEVTCLTVSCRGSCRAAVVNFGLHPAILAGDNWLYSADFPGYFAEYMSRQDVCENPLFLNGCCGNVNHVDYQNQPQGRGFEMARRVGERLGESASKAIESAVSVDGGEVQISKRMVSLDRLVIDEDQRRWCERVLDEAASCPPVGQVDGLPDAYFANLRLKMQAVQHETDQVEVMVIRLGSMALVGLPGEAFCELGLEIKRRSPAGQTMVAGLANDAIGYLPTHDAFAQGGYETITGSTFYQPGSAERLVESAVDQLHDLFLAD